MSSGIPVVIDNGSGSTKAGFAGAEGPKSIFPTIIGSPKSNQLMVGGQNKDFFVGFEAVAKAALLNLRQPIDNGLATNWDDMERLWNHTFYNELLTSPDEHPVVLTEKPMCPRMNREKMIQIMFETFNVRGFYSGVQAVLALFSLGRTTGVVWDAGEGVSFTVPIYEGYGLPHAILRSALSGSDLTNLLMKMLAEGGYDPAILKFAEVRAMKEQVCQVALDYQAEIQKAEAVKAPKARFQLSNGLEVAYGTEYFRCPEALFTPSIAGSASDGIQQFIHIALERCDVDVRKELYSSIVLCGGTSMFRGLAERMEKEVVALATPQMKVNVTATPERKNSVWLGGSVLGSLDAFPQMMIDQTEYRDEGVQIVHKKCYS
jgi:actin-related protein